MWKRGEQPNGPAILVAHRGGVSDVVPDPVEAVRRLVAEGVPMVEFDVRATRDGVFVIRHEPTIDGQKLSAMPYERLQRMADPPPTLASFLDAADGRIALDVELKEPGREHELLAAVLERNAVDSIVLTSFDAGSLARAKAAVPELSTGLLVGRWAGWKTPLYGLRDVFPWRRLDAVRADFLAPSDLVMRTGMRWRARRRGVRLLAWTINDAGAIARLRADPQMLGVVTDSIAAR